MHIFHGLGTSILTNDMVEKASHLDTCTTVSQMLKTLPVCTRSFAPTDIVVPIRNQGHQTDPEGYPTLDHLLSRLRDGTKGKALGHVHDEHDMPKVSFDLVERTLSTGSSELPSIFARVNASAHTLAASADLRR